MAGIDIKFEFDDRQFQLACLHLIDRGERLRPLMLDIGEMLLESTRARFTTKTAPDGQAWKPLHPKTLAKKGGKGSTLVFEGYLRDLMRAEAGDDFVDIGSALEYSALHQLGGTSEMAPGPAAVEARPYLGMSEDDKRNVLEIGWDYLAATPIG